MPNENVENFAFRDAQNDVIALLLFLQGSDHSVISQEGDELMGQLFFHTQGPHKNELMGLLSEVFMTATNPKHTASLYCGEIREVLGSLGFIDHFASGKHRGIRTEPHILSADKLVLPSPPATRSNVRVLKPRRPTDIRQDQDVPFPVAARR